MLVETKLPTKSKLSTSAIIAMVKFLEPTAVVLEHSITIYVPSTFAGEDASEEMIVREIRSAKRFLADLFGGTTTVTGDGSWVDADHSVIDENVTLVTAFAESLTLDNLAKVKSYALQLKEYMRQQSVAIGIDGMLFLM